MKRAIALTLLGGVLGISWGSSSQAETLVLKYSSWVPQNYYLNTEAYLPWADQVAKVTEGRVKIEMLPKIVGTAQSQYDVCRDGLADVCFPIVGYTPGRFPLAEIGELPFLGDNPAEANAAFNNFYMANFSKYNEFKDVAFLAAYTFAPFNVYTKGKKLDSVAAFSGLKIRVPGPTATKIVELLRGVPILKATNETYEMLSTGTIDGLITTDESVLAQNFIEQLNTATYVPGGITNSVHVAIINKDKWNSISPKDQELIQGISGEYLARAVGKAAASANQRGNDAIKAKGYAISTVSGNLLDDLKVALTPLSKDWESKAKAKGVENAGAVLEAFRKQMSQ